jgi:hypothetical protein
VRAGNFLQESKKPVSALIHVRPEIYQDDIFELRSELAVLAREGPATPHDPRGVVLGFLADHATFTGQQRVGHTASLFAGGFRAWQFGKPHAAAVAPPDFQRLLAQFLQATSLDYTYNPDTSSIASVFGLRYSPAVNTPRGREAFLLAVVGLEPAAQADRAAYGRAD